MKTSSVVLVAAMSQPRNRRTPSRVIESARRTSRGTLRAAPPCMFIKICFRTGRGFWRGPSWVSTRYGSTVFIHLTKGNPAQIWIGHTQVLNVLWAMDWVCCSAFVGAVDRFENHFHSVGLAVLGVRPLGPTKMYRERFGLAEGCVFLAAGEDLLDLAAFGDYAMAVLEQKLGDLPTKSVEESAAVLGQGFGTWGVTPDSAVGETSSFVGTR